MTHSIEADVDVALARLRENLGREAILRIDARLQDGLARGEEEVWVTLGPIRCVRGRVMGPLPIKVEEHVKST